MAVVWALSRNGLRRQWVGALALVVLLGVPAGTVLGAAAGARRNATAYPRLLRAGAASDLLVNPNNGTQSKLDVAKVARLPQVAAVGRVDGMIVTPDRDGRPDVTDVSSLMTLARDRAWGSTVDRPKLLDGRLPAYDRINEVAVNRRLSDARHLVVGDRLRFHVFTASDIEVLNPRRLPAHDVLSARVVGIFVSNTDIAVNEANQQREALFSPALLRAHPDSSAYYGLALRLRRGRADVAAVKRAIDRLAPRESIVYQTRADEVASVARATQPQTGALLAFAAVAALALLLTGGQALGRHLRSASADTQLLGALGCTRQQIFQSLLLRAGLVATGVGLVAVVVAIGLSGLTPVGIGRSAEPHPGVDVNAALLVLGGLLISALLVVGVIGLSWRLAHGSSGRAVTRTSRLVDRLGSRPTIALGVRHAVDNGGDGLVPIRSAVAGSTLALTWVIAAAVFAASLTHFVDTPRLWGWGWDAMVTVSGDDEVSSQAPRVAAILARQADLTAVSIAAETELRLEGQVVTALAVTPVKGPNLATIVSGRAPNGTAEVALGRHTMRELHVAIGGEVRARDRGGHTRPLRVTGQAVFPGLAAYPGEDPTSLARGALVSVRAFHEMGAPLGADLVLVRWDGEAGHRAARRALGPFRDHLASGDWQLITRPKRPADVIGLTEVRLTPYLLAIVLGTLALVTIGHALVTSVRRRRREMAILKAIGFRRRQIAAIVAWQATTLVTVALAVAVPLGIAGGRLAWSLVARQLGVPSVSLVPPVIVLSVVFLALLTANVLAALPASTARRLPAAIVLRAE